MDKKRPLKDIIESLKRTGVSYPYIDFAYSDCRPEDKAKLDREINRLKLMGYLRGPHTREEYLETIAALYQDIQEFHRKRELHEIRIRNNGKAAKTQHKTQRKGTLAAPLSFQVVTHNSIGMRV